MASDYRLIEPMGSKCPKALGLKTKLSKNKTPTAQLWPRSGQGTEVLPLMINFIRLPFIFLLCSDSAFPRGSSKLEKTMLG